MSESEAANPCVHCGACCACFRVSFYWSEAETRGLPEHLLEQLNPWLACMVGTNAAQPRCAALSGEPGGPVRCSVYELRPSPCREVELGDAQCRKARRHYGLEEI